MMKFDETNLIIEEGAWRTLINWLKQSHAYNFEVYPCCVVLIILNPSFRNKNKKKRKVFNGVTTHDAIIRASNWIKTDKETV